MGSVDKAWSLVASGGSAVDAETLFFAIVDPDVLKTTDPRTQLLLRDAFDGLRLFWGRQAFEKRIDRLPLRGKIESILSDPSPDVGFPSLRRRIVNVTDPRTLERMCRELGNRLAEPTSITVGGSFSLMLADLVSRQTEDIDVVDELPPPIRRELQLLSDLSTRYGLKLTHFQSHYLPRGWEARTWSLGVFGQLSVRVVDSGDVLIGKLFSSRAKDLDDFRHAFDRVDQTSLRRRIAEDTASFRNDAKSLAAAQENWYIVTGERTLPSAV